VSSARAPLTCLYPVVKAPSLGRFALPFLPTTRFTATTVSAIRHWLLEATLCKALGDQIIAKSSYSGRRSCGRAVRRHPPELTQGYPRKRDNVADQWCGSSEGHFALTQVNAARGKEVIV
jgi:hypothetical protein